MSRTAATLQDLQERFVALHTRKEDLFWAAKMGLAADPQRAHHDLAEAEIAVNRFLQDPERLRGLRELGAAAGATPAQHRVLDGWIAMFAAHAIELPAARTLSEEIVAREAELQQRRGGMELGLRDPITGAFEPASSVKLALTMRTDADEGRRRAAFDALCSIEVFVLDHGFLDIVTMRNRLGRMLGYEDYYDWRVSVVERMSKARLFEVLGDLEARTREAARSTVDAFAERHGALARDPWNFPFLRNRDTVREIDPYFAFSSALGRWMRSFAAAGVRFRGATLTLDLVDRAGKYENGFMHGPGPAFFDGGTWRPARINFTANAVPGAIGSGFRAIETLFHEGGHAAHFSNILSDAPCFSQEFAPTSVAYAETQSMFMDSLLSDADWRARYATDAAGRSMPLELIDRAIRDEQPMRVWDIRAMLTVALGERAIYEIPEAELSPERVQRELRDVERRTQFLSSGVRPVLAVPHLLAGEASAYYHGYILAQMAVAQTRELFLARDGHLTDNPRLGRDLAEHYWAPGNALAFDDILRGLTGSALSADALVSESRETVDAALARAHASVERLREVPASDAFVDLDAHVKVVHGPELVADTARDGWEGAASKFAVWIDGLEKAASSSPPPVQAR